MVFASIREYAEHCDFFASTSRNKKKCFASLRTTQKLGEHEQASTRLNFASKSSKGKILRAVKNFNGPFITPNRITNGVLYLHHPFQKHKGNHASVNELPRLICHWLLSNSISRFILHCNHYRSSHWL